MTASILSGARLIWLVNKAPYVHVMQQVCFGWLSESMSTSSR